MKQQHRHPQRNAWQQSARFAAYKGDRNFASQFADGVFRFEEHPVHFEREQRLKGRYVIATSERAMTAWDAVSRYKQLTEVERGFRRLKNALSMRLV